jgi:uncharacterized membrane protein
VNKRTILIVLVSLLVVPLVVGIVGAQTSTSFDLSWYVLGGGGKRTDSAAYAMNGTLGQGIVGVSDDTGFQVQSGYWYGASLPGCRVYLPLVLRSYP